MPKFGERLDGSFKEPEPGLHPSAEQEEPGTAAEEPAPVAIGENVPILTMTWSLNVPGLNRLIEEMRKIDLG